MNKLTWIFFVLTISLSRNVLAQTGTISNSKMPFLWENATIFSVESAEVKSGEFARIANKLDDGYFERLGISAICLSNIFEQLGGTENVGDNHRTFDFTKPDSSFGTDKELAELIAKAHKKGIRILLNAQLNHVGASSLGLSPWPSEWVRTHPICDSDSYESTTSCAIDKSLPDLKTESDDSVSLPDFLSQKWKKEGRLERETSELDAFFTLTNYPRAPRFYIIKWVTDYIRKYGIDGYIIENVQNVDLQIWGELKSQSNMAFAEWKQKNVDKVLDDREFYMIGDVPNIGLSDKGNFNYGNKKVNYYQNGFNNLFNASFIKDADKGYEFLFAEYSAKLNNELEGSSILNSASAKSNYTFGTKLSQLDLTTTLLLAPGIAQLPTNFDDKSEAGKALVIHIEKLANFRKNHPSVGAGVHQRISTAPYVFSRGYTIGKISDRVIIGIDLPPGRKEVHMASLFKNNTLMRDAYSGKEAIVKSGRLSIDTPFTILLLEEK